MYGIIFLTSRLIKTQKAMRTHNDEFYPDEFSRSRNTSGEEFRRGSNYEDPWFYRPAESYQTTPGMAWRDNRGKAPRGYKRSDQRIMDDIFDVVSSDFMLDSSDVEINVSNGVVTLSGYVLDRRDKRRIEDVVESIPGVIDVENRIRVNTERGIPTNLSREDQGNKDTQLRSFVDDISSR